MTKKTTKAKARRGQHQHIIEPLRHLALPIELLNPDPANANKHPEKNLSVIKGSLDRFKQRTPLVVQKDGMIIRKGNGTYAQAKALGWTHLAVVVVDEDNDSAAAYAIADNRAGELSEWDEDVLTDVLASIDESLLDATGFDDDDLKKLTGEVEKLSGESRLAGLEFRVVVEGLDEQQQRALIERLQGEGYKCQALMS